MRLEVILLAKVSTIQFRPQCDNNRHKLRSCLLSLCTMTTSWKCFLHYWLFMRGTSGFLSQKARNMELWCNLVVSKNKLFNNQVSIDLRCLNPCDVALMPTLFSVFKASCAAFRAGSARARSSSQDLCFLDTSSLMTCTFFSSSSATAFSLDTFSVSAPTTVMSLLAASFFWANSTSWDASLDFKSSTYSNT